MSDVPLHLCRFCMQIRMSPEMGTTCWFVYWLNRYLALSSPFYLGRCPFTGSAWGKNGCCLRVGTQLRREGWEVLNTCPADKQTGTKHRTRGSCPSLDVTTAFSPATYKPGQLANFRVPNKTTQPQGILQCIFAATATCTQQRQTLYVKINVAKYKPPLKALAKLQHM